MILEAIKEIEKLDPFNDTIIGYNNLKFDVPFMLERLKILGKAKPNIGKFTIAENSIPKKLRLKVRGNSQD